MVDLPHHSVIVGGLESWMGEMKPIAESRLEQSVADFLGLPTVKLYAPPPPRPVWAISTGGGGGSWL